MGRDRRPTMFEVLPGKALSFGKARLFVPYEIGHRVAEQCTNVTVSFARRRNEDLMTTKLKFEFERGPFILPEVQDIAVYSGSKTVQLALSVEDDAGLPTIVFVPIPR